MQDIESFLLENELDSKSIEDFRQKIEICDNDTATNKSKEIYGILKRKSLSSSDIKKIEKLILDGADVNYRNLDNSKKKKRPKGYSLLFVAASKGHVEAVKLLLRAGAFVDLTTVYGSTPLIRASRNGRVEIVEILLAMGADVNHVNNYGSSSLMWASRGGHLEVMDKLIEALADVNLMAIDGDTALISASRHNKYEAVQKLVQNNAYINVTNIVGEDACSVTTSEKIKNYLEKNLDTVLEEYDVATGILDTFDELLTDCEKFAEYGPVKVKK